MTQTNSESKGIETSNSAIRSMAVAAVALGAAAIGALAVGALAIGRLRILEAALRSFQSVLSPWTIRNTLAIDLARLPLCYGGTIVIRLCFHSLIELYQRLYVREVRDVGNNLFAVRCEGDFQLIGS